MRLHDTVIVVQQVNLDLKVKKIHHRYEITGLSGDDCFALYSDGSTGKLTGISSVSCSKCSSEAVALHRDCCSTGELTVSNCWS